MKVGIVGAGVSGLGAARTLLAAGHHPTVFEQAPRCGGRCATRVISGYVFDTGVTSIAPRGRTIEAPMLHELDTTGLHLIESPIYTHTGSRVGPGDSVRNRIPRYTYRQGNARLGELLCQGVDVRSESLVARFHRTNGSFELNGDVFEALILTAPAPATAQLLEASDERRPIAQASYRACLSVLLGYELPAPSHTYHALIDPDQRHPLTWLSLESVKCPDRAPEGCTALVAQMSSSYSKQEFDAPEAEIVRDAATFVSRILGPQWGAPAVSGVKRWRYSLPEGLALFDTVNHPGSKLLIAGDALLGGRVEYAYDTGVRAAQMLLGVDVSKIPSI